MTTVYTAYDDDKPDSTQTGTAFANSSKNNLLAIRDEAVKFGMVAGWNMSITVGGGSEALPDEYIFTRTIDGAVQKVKITNDWTGSELTKVKFEYSADNGATWDNMDDSDGNYVLNFTYSSGVCVSTTWNATWS